MASTLSEWTNKTITILTTDGRLITGILKGYDQLQNLIVSKSYEKVYSTDAPPERVELGLSVVRGDNVAVVAEVDEEDQNGKKDEEEADVRADPIKAIVQNVT